MNTPLTIAATVLAVTLPCAAAGYQQHAQFANQAAATTGRAAEDVRATASDLVPRILRADYEGDRDALRQLHEQIGRLKTPVDDPQLTARVHYWQAFALWRRAFNGFSQSADRADLERDLRQALDLFESARASDPKFVDATVGAISCLQSLTGLYANDQKQVKELVTRFMQMLKSSLAEAPGNPRLLWVNGSTELWSPPTMPTEQKAARQATGMATYKRGVELARRQKQAESDPLEPAWGEAELLMSLAWTSLNQTTPDPRAAEEYARQALEVVPNWRYVRDVLLPQIRSAMPR